ncbi:hypothetical protein MPER_14665 [Moniliophthora perniciosa FA553]|nr:hypothetical protein MPER_14665 [Moniliophthora perniciosa FA553]
MAVGFTGYMFWWILRWNAVETESNSMERITHYLEIEQERKPTQAGIPPAYWPSSGELRVENLSAKYSSEGPTVLRGLTFHLKAGERIGVVGRTGSGKVCGGIFPGVSMISTAFIRVPWLCHY